MKKIDLKSDNRRHIRFMLKMKPKIRIEIKNGNLEYIGGNGEECEITLVNWDKPMGARRIDLELGKDGKVIPYLTKIS